MSNLRCHLLIGPPASGKTTLSQSLAPLLNATIISTDLIRKELWGDELYQGPWKRIEEKVLTQLHNCVSEGRSVLIDATHAKRPWRLAITQGIIFDQPIEWIGWWLKTPKEVCLKWNKERGHYDFGEIDWEEFRRSMSGGGPCSRERLAHHIKVHSEGEWVREAMRAYEKKKCLDESAAQGDKL